MSLSGHVRSPIQTDSDCYRSPSPMPVCTQQSAACMCALRMLKASPSCLVPVILLGSFECTTALRNPNKNREGVDGYSLTSLSNPLHHACRHSLFNLQISFPYILQPPRLLHFHASIRLRPSLSPPLPQFIIGPSSKLVRTWRSS